MKNTKRWLKNWNLKQRSDKNLLCMNLQDVFSEKNKQTLHAGT